MVWQWDAVQIINFLLLTYTEDTLLGRWTCKKLTRLHDWFVPHFNNSITLAISMSFCTVQGALYFKSKSDLRTTWNCSVALSKSVRRPSGISITHDADFIRFYSPTCTMSPSASPAPLNPPIETRFGDADGLFDRDLSGSPEVSVVSGFLSFARFSDYINWLTINPFWQNDDTEATRLEGIKSLYDTSLPVPKFRKSEIGNSTNLARHSIELIDDRWAHNTIKTT